MTQSNGFNLAPRFILNPAFIAFGNAPSVVINGGFQLPANSAMTFNFKSGDKVAVIAGSASAITIVDLD